MTEEEFFRWHSAQPTRFELVDGVPWPREAITRRCDRIITRMLSELVAQLEGCEYEPFSGRIGVRIPNGNLRFPALGVDIRAFTDDAMVASCPKLVMEFGPGFQDVGLQHRLENYQAVDTLEYILLLDPAGPAGMLHFRGPDRRWMSDPIRNIDAVVRLENIGIRLRFANLYKGLPGTY